MSDYSEQYQNIQFNEINRKKKVRRKKHYLLRFIILLLLLTGGFLFLSSELFEIKTVEVSGNHYYSEEQVINLAEAKTGENIFWGKATRDIKKKLHRDPYFKEVKLKRILPGKLKIRVKERKQVAAAVYGEEFVVIDGEGTVLRRSDVDPKITALYGLTISKLKEGEPLEAEEKTRLGLALKLLEAMEEGNLFFKKIDLSGVVVYAYIYDTLLVKGTPKQIVSAIEKGDLQKVINNLLQQNTTRGTISMGDHNYMSFSPNF